MFLPKKIRIKNKIVSNIKNIPGWKTKRRLLAFAVDDYGNIKLAGSKEKQKLQSNGVLLKGRFDHFDALDTRQDYEQLFQVLESVRDKRNRHAVFTTYALPANVNYKETLRQGEYIAEDLDVTYDRLSETTNPNIEERKSRESAVLDFELEEYFEKEQNKSNDKSTQETEPANNVNNK